MTQTTNLRLEKNIKLTLTMLCLVRRLCWASLTRLGEVEEATEKEKIGAMVWCPERVSSREELAQYLANVRATPELDKDIFAILISERGVWRLLTIF